MSLEQAYEQKCKQCDRLAAENAELVRHLENLIDFTGAHGGPYAEARAALSKVKER